MIDEVLPWAVRARAAGARAVRAPGRRRLARRAPPDAGDEGWRIDILDSIHAIDAASWDALVGNAAATRSHAYLAAVEAAAVAGCRYFYVVVRDRRETIRAHACVYVATTDFAQLMPRPVRALTRVLRRLWPRLLTARITECAAPLVAGSSLSTAADCDRGAMLALIEQGMRTLARREGSSCLVVRDFFAGERPMLAFLARRGYKRVSNLPLARIRVRWPTYAAYVAAMRSRYRKDLRRRMARAAREGHSVECCAAFGEHAAEWARQAAAVHALATGFKREVVNAAYYANMAALRGSECRLLLVRRGGRAVAHGMVLSDDATTIATYFGREPGPPCGEWFLLANEVVRVAIERGSQEIWFGFGAYEAKTLLGAEIVPLDIYTRCTHPLLNAVVKVLPDFMNRGARPRRRVFRE